MNTKQILLEVAEKLPPNWNSAILIPYSKAMSTRTKTLIGKIKAAPEPIHFHLT